MENKPICDMPYTFPLLYNLQTLLTADVSNIIIW